LNTTQTHLGSVLGVLSFGASFKNILSQPFIRCLTLGKVLLSLLNFLTIKGFGGGGGQEGGLCTFYNENTKNSAWLGMVMHTFVPSIQGIEAGRSL
jgi:hypothetical protein